MIERDEILRALYGKGTRLNLETQLVQSVIEHLTLKMGFPAYRRNVGATRYPSPTGKGYFVRFAERGQADVWAIGPDGVHIEIELKRPGIARRCPLSDFQERWIAKVKSAGGIALWASSLEEMASGLKAEFERRGIPWNPSWTI